MTQVATVRVSLDVTVGPEEAFRVFTEEIGAWYKVDEHSVADPDTVALRFEPGVGGRLLEVHDPGSGDGREVGRVRVWEPGRRLVYRDGRDLETDVTFEGHGRGTRVTVEQRGLGRLPPDDAEHAARYGVTLILRWFAEHMRVTGNPQGP